MNTTTHTLEYYRKKELDVFPKIPGMKELLKLQPGSTVNVAEKYPDAAFALMTANELLGGDRERNAINQEAYFEILQGKNIADIRQRHHRAMDRYLRDHLWDD